MRSRRWPWVVLAVIATLADVHVVVAHDPIALQEDLRAGLFQSGFSER